jgi:hypothetical protein
MNRVLAGCTATAVFGVSFGLGYGDVVSAGARVEVVPPGGGVLAVEGYDPARLGLFGKGLVAFADMSGTARPSLLVAASDTPETPQSAQQTTTEKMAQRYETTAFVPKQAAQTALEGLLKTNSSGCATKDTKSPQPVLDAKDPKTRVCLKFTEATVASNGEVQVSPYLPDHLGDLQATLTDPTHSAACIKLTGLLQTMGGELLDTAGSLPDGKHVAVGVRVLPDPAQNQCDKHDLSPSTPKPTKKGPQT